MKNKILPLGWKLELLGSVDIRIRLMERQNPEFSGVIFPKSGRCGHGR
jgi:hypothetical protein